MSFAYSFFNGSIWAGGLVSMSDEESIFGIVDRGLDEAEEESERDVDDVLGFFV